jgi:hypothetical protein
VSDTILRIIPGDPGYVPSATARESATGILLRALPNADDVSGQLTRFVRFVDCGDNFQSVSCPRCGTDIGEWWATAMEAAHEHQFAALDVVTPCCGAPTTLNRLFYVPVVGFARYSLEAINPHVGSLPERALQRLQSTLGCQLRVIWAHY